MILAAPISKWATLRKPLKCKITELIDFIFLYNFFISFRFQQKINSEKCSPLAQTWLYHEIGRCYYEMKEFDDSLEYANRALDAAKAEANRKWIVNCHLLAAQAYIGQNKLEQAIVEFDAAEENFEGDEDNRRVIRNAIEQTKRAHEEKSLVPQDDVITTYRVSLEVASVEMAEGQTKADAFGIFVGSDGKKTTSLVLGSLSQESDVLDSEPAHQSIENMDHADIWLDGASKFEVKALTVEDEKSGKRWTFDATGGQWESHEDDSSKQVWRMTAQQV